jgi:hypothetical protein
MGGFVSYFYTIWFGMSRISWAGVWRVMDRSKSQRNIYIDVVADLYWDCRVPTGRC